MASAHRAGLIGEADAPPPDWDQGPVAPAPPGEAIRQRTPPPSEQGAGPTEVRSGYRLREPGIDDYIGALPAMKKEITGNAHNPNRDDNLRLVVTDELWALLNSSGETSFEQLCEIQPYLNINYYSIDGKRPDMSWYGKVFSAWLRQNHP